MQLEAPTDAQLGYIASLCQARELPLPAAVASKQEASRIIEELRGWKYVPENYAFPWDGAV